MIGRSSLFDILIAGLVVVVAGGIAVSGIYQLGHTDAFQSVGTVVLSALLVKIYSQQADTMARQAELMRIDQEPVVSFEKYDPDDDGVDIWLSNSGRGTATDLRFNLEIKLPDGAVLRTPDDNSPLARKEDEVWQSGRSLHRRQTGVHYYGIPVVEIADENGAVDARRFRPVTEILLSRDVTEFEFRLSVIYATEVGDERELPLRSLHAVELADPLTLKDAIERSREYPYSHSRWEDETASVHGE